MEQAAICALRPAICIAASLTSGVVRAILALTSWRDDMRRWAVSLKPSVTVGIVPPALEESGNSIAGVTEQCFVDVIERRGGALDVQQDGADLAQLEAVRTGMYEGPRHNG